jgi:ABC-type branched-subunit amino acid transport system substrate-binding protein
MLLKSLWVAGLVVLSFCNISLAYADNDKSVRQLKIAVLASLTGDYAHAGEQISRGAQLAIEDLEKENIKVKLFTEDACLPAAGVSVHIAR